MQKLVKTLVALAIAVAALAAALVLLWINPGREQAQNHVFSDRQATQVQTVRVENENGVFYVRAQDGGYTVADIPAELIDIDAFIAFLIDCSEISARKRVTAGGNAADFGLDAPQARVDVTYLDGGDLTLLLGDREPLSGDYYASAEGDGGVYLLAAETAESWLIARQALISFYITPKLNVSSALSALGDVTFAGGPLAEPVTITSVSSGGEAVRALARSFGAATHIVQGAGVYELDQTYGLTVLSPLCGLTAQAIVGYGLSARQLAEYGFDEPYMQVDFDYKNGVAEAVHYTLRITPADEAGQLFYANTLGSSVVYVIKREAFLDIAYEKLLLRWFLSPLLMDITGVTVETGAHTAKFTVDNSDLKNPVAALNGQPLDIGRFRQFFKLLCSAANDGQYLGEQPQPSGRPVMRITYHYSGGKADDVLALYAGDARRVSVSVNGVCEFAMKDAFVARVSEALSALKSGEAFDINW